MTDFRGEKFAENTSSSLISYTILTKEKKEDEYTVMQVMYRDK